MQARSRMDMQKVQIDAMQQALSKKTENKNKCLKKLDEIENRYSEVCTKNGLQADISRPDFTAGNDDLMEISNTNYRLKAIEASNATLKKKKESETAEK